MYLFSASCAIGISNFRGLSPQYSELPSFCAHENVENCASLASQPAKRLQYKYVKNDIAMIVFRYFSGSIALFVAEEGGGRRRSVEKSKGGTFLPRLEIPQERRDFHFSHRRCGDYDESRFRFSGKKKKLISDLIA